MRAERCGAILASVATHLRIMIDLELTEPVSGSLSSDGGEPIAFSGWLELHSGLEASCAAAERRDAATARRAERAG